MSEVPHPEGWNPRDAITGCTWREVHGLTWRVHWQGYPALSWEGSRWSSGRYNRSEVEFPAETTWLALYLAMRPEIPWAEITRHSRVTPRHNQFLLSTVEVHLHSVVDCRDSNALGIDTRALILDQNREGTAYHLPQDLALAAVERGADGLLAPSATLLGDTLVVFPQNLRRDGAELRLIESRPMRPYNPDLDVEDGL